MMMTTKLSDVYSYYFKLIEIVYGLRLQSLYALLNMLIAPCTCQLLIYWSEVLLSFLTCSKFKT